MKKMKLILKTQKKIKEYDRIMKLKMKIIYVYP